MLSKTTTTRERILESACLLFAEHGYAQVSTRMIAEKAAVKLGSIHYHFKSKEALYFDVFHDVFDLENALNHEKLLAKEPTILDTPEGKVYAIQQIVADFFHRHIYIPEEWKRKLVFRELFDNSPVFLKLVEEVLIDESRKMLQFYYLLVPNGSPLDAYYWAHLPDTQALYYLMSGPTLGEYYDKDFLDGLSRNVIKSTTRIMIAELGLPVPDLLK